MPPAEVRVLDAKWEKMVISSKGIRWQVKSKLSFTILVLYRFCFCALGPFPRLFLTTHRKRNSTDLSRPPHGVPRDFPA